MAIEFHCPVCGENLRVDDDAIGLVVRCGGCLSMLRVPNPETAPNEFPDAPETPFNDRSQPTPPARPVPPPPPSTFGEPPEKRPSAEPSRQPRRRQVRQEPVPPPAGASPFHWAILTLCAVGFGFCIMCCATGILLQGERWRMVQSTKGDFKVELPASPRKVMTLPIPNFGPNWSIEGTRVAGSGDEYAVLYKDIEPRNQRKLSDERLLAQIASSIAKVLGMQQAQEDKQDNEVFGFPYRDLTYQNPNGGVYLLRVIVADKRTYILVVGGSEGLPDSENIQHFFNSFALTDLNMIKAGRERKDNLLKQQQENEEKKKSLVEAQKLMNLSKNVVDVAIAQANGDQLVAHVAALGTAVAEAPLERVAAEKERLERLRLDSLGRELGTAALGVIAREQEQTKVALLGSNIGLAAVNVATGEQERVKLASQLAQRVEEQKVRSLGQALGGAMTRAIDIAREGEEKR